MDYLDFWVIHKVVRPFDEKMVVIKDMTQLPDRKRGIKSIVLLNHYRDIWERCLHTIIFLTNLISIT